MEALEKAIALANSALPILGFTITALTSLWMYIFHTRTKMKRDQSKDSNAPVLQGTPVPTDGNSFEMMTLGILKERIEELEDERDRAHAALRAHGIPIP